MAYLVVVCFVLVFALTLSVGGYYYYLRPRRLIRAVARADRDPRLASPWVTRAKAAAGRKFIQQLSNVAPKSPDHGGPLRRQLQMAGYRDPLAATVYSAARVLAVLIGLGAGLLGRSLTTNPASAIALPIACIAVGLFAPGMILDRLVTRRQQRLHRALPDALDLLVICCEVGCGLDQAIQTVAREFHVVHKDLSEELSLINMEILAGASRPTALRNFATRTGLEDIRKMTAILIQTDRFGTSIADALRSQADFMRVRRRQDAEERAGKVGVKLVFPIFLFCMPALMVFVAGPGMIQMFQMFHKLANNQ